MVWNIFSSQNKFEIWNFKIKNKKIKYNNNKSLKMP